MEILEIIGQLDGTAFALALLFIAFDVITGYAQAVANKTVSSTKMKTGFLTLKLSALEAKRLPALYPFQKFPAQRALKILITE